MAKAECGVWFSLGMPFGNYQHFWFNNSFDNPKQTLIYEPFKPDWGGVHVHTSLPEGVPGDQDANRARNQLKAFAAERGLSFAAWYVENESGAKLARPELFRLLADGQPGDVLLVEQVDRLSRLTSADWEKLKAELTMRRVRVVALDLQTSWMMVTGNADEFAGRMFEAINGMLLDMLAAVARKDYRSEERRVGKECW